MKKRIFASMLLITISCLLVSTIVVSMVFYNRISLAAQNDVRERALMLQNVISIEGYGALSMPDMRVTVIEANGTVLYDDDLNIATMPSHVDREEFREALDTGIGESRRFSDTLGQETYYFAVKLKSGAVLRVAKTIGSIWSMFVDAIPAILGVVVVLGAIAYLLSVRLTRRIVRPINDVDLNGDLSAPYDELAPFVRTIASQRDRIAEQISALQERSDTIDSLMDNIAEGIVLVDRQGLIMTINKSARSFFDIPQNPEHRNFSELFRNIELIHLLRDALANVRGEMTLEHGLRIYRVYFSPVPGIGAMILFLDITERARAETMRREFSANVSHELKTPLTTIMGNAEMLACGMVKENDKPDFFAKIRDEARRMITLIEDILLLSELDEAAGHQHTEAVDLAAVAAQAVEALSPKASEKHVSVQLDGSKVMMPANSSQMFELFHNLIENAIKYNRPGGNVQIRVTEDKGNIAIWVTDTGIGIPLDAQDRVFERFYRVDKSRSKETGGTGLGLAIVKHIVLIHNGHIELHSKINEGSEFKIFFHT